MSLFWIYRLAPGRLGSFLVGRAPEGDGLEATAPIVKRGVLLGGAGLPNPPLAGRADAPAAGEAGWLPKLKGVAGDVGVGA